MHLPQLLREWETLSSSVEAILQQRNPGPESVSPEASQSKEEVS